MCRKSRSRDSLSSDITSESSKSRKKRRNRLVDIDDIIIEFDPQKEFLWEMRQKYEHKKKRQSSQDLDVASGGAQSGEQVAESSEVDVAESNSTPTTPVHINASISNSDNVSTIQLTSTLPSQKESLDTRTRSKHNSDMLGEDLETDYCAAPQVDESTEDFMSMGSLDKDEDDLYDQEEEVLVLHRLPGEKLGMGVSIESTGGDSDPVRAVYIDTVAPGGAADRATGGSKGLCVGDEILEVNGAPLRHVTYSETLTFFREMPLRVTLRVRRQKDPKTHQGELGDVVLPEGYVLKEVRFHKDQEDSLGLTIVPSIADLYQVSFLFLLAFSFLFIYFKTHLPASIMKYNCILVPFLLTN